MRVATYTQPTAVTRGSLAGLVLLVAAVLLGTSTVLQLTQQLAPALSGGVTVLWLCAYSAAFVGLMAGHGINWISWLTRYRILLVVLILGTMLSIVWAYDTRLSIERTVHLIGSTLIAFYIGFTIPLLNILRVLAVVLGIVFIASTAAALFMPVLGIEQYEGRAVWRGVMNSKNALGFWAAVGVLLYLTLSDSVHTASMRMVCYLMAALSLVLLVFSHSATSLLVMIVAGAFSLYLFIAARFRLSFISMLILAILMIGLVALIGSNISAAELIGRSDDLTGRGEVWRQTWQLIMQRPLTGFGYGVLWFPSDETTWIQESLTDFTWTVHHAHNGFLQVASEIGLPLAAIASLWVVQQLIEIVYCQYQRQQAGVLFVLAFALTYLLSNFSEARFLVNRELFWILFIALPISMLRQINLQAPVEAPAAPESVFDGYSRNPAARGHAGAGAASALATPSISGMGKIAQQGGEGDVASATSAVQQFTAEGAPAPRQPDLDESEWTEDVFDTTISALTIADADIDLGAADSAFGSMDGLPEGPLRAPINQASDHQFAGELGPAVAGDEKLKNTDKTDAAGATDDALVRRLDRDFSGVREQTQDAARGLDRFDKVITEEGPLDDDFTEDLNDELNASKGYTGSGGGA